ncbi:hypothetical protein [Rhizobium sp. ZW T2_16]|uniref:hypothetical protein n=1 Tax=Rhizobium sp. ZW T2_16 TaxID=3378083 RepID=UPI00385343EE
MDWTGLDYEKIANALVILVTGLAVGLGFRRGRRDGGGTAPTLEVAAALVDSSSVRNLENAVKDVRVAIEEGTEENLNYRKSLERAVKDMTESIDELTKGLASLEKEMIREKH